MTRALLTCTALAALLLTHAAAQDRRLAGSASLRGRVVDSAGRGVARANVTISTASAGATTMVRALHTTAPDGSFEGTGYPAGSYTFRVTKPGFVAPPARILKLNDGELFEAGDISIAKAGVITGRVLDEDGGPVEGAIVEIMTFRYQNGRTEVVSIDRQSGSLAARPLVSDDLGRYRAYDLQPGRYLVSARLTDAAGPVPPVLDVRRYARTFYPSQRAPQAAVAVSLGPEQEMGEVDIALAAGRSVRVSGVALDADGRPFRGSIALRSSSRANAIVMTWPEARVTPDGSFEFTSVPPGEYVVQATRRAANGAEATFAFEYVRAGTSDIAGLKLVASEGSTVSGRVVVEGGAAGLTPWLFEIVPGATDFDRAPLITPAFRGALRDDWSFEMRGLSGPRLFRTHYIGGGAYGVKAVFANGLDVTDNPLLLGTREQSVTDLEIVVSNALGAVRGQVSGATTDKTAVVAFSTDRSRWHPFSRFVGMTVPNGAGEFVIGGLPSGEYFVAAAARIEEDEWQHPAVLDALRRRATRVSILERQQTTVAIEAVVVSAPR